MKNSRMSFSSASPIKSKAFDESLKLYTAALELAATSSGAKKRFTTYGNLQVDARSPPRRDGCHLPAKRSSPAGSRAVLEATARSTSVIPSTRSGLPASLNILSTRRELPPRSRFCSAHGTSPGRTGCHPWHCPTRNPHQPPYSMRSKCLTGINWNPPRSQYAKYILDLLKAKGHGQVLNRQELIQAVNGLDYFVPEESRLEPNGPSVLLASLAILSRFPGVTTQRD